MSSIETGTVTGIDVVSYDATKDSSNNPNSTSYSQYAYNNIIDNLQNIKEVLVLSIQNDMGGFQEVERITDLGITSSWFYALNCFAVSLYDPSVLFASIAVECVLNHDMRLEKYWKLKRDGWLYLNWNNLASAFYDGLPVKNLMNQGEIFEKDSIEFVNRRNKVAHGDIVGYRNMYPPVFQKNVFQNNVFQMGHSRPSKEHAIDQINKSKDFIVAWAKQMPKVRLH